MKKITYYIRTNSLERDDRFNKTQNFLSQSGWEFDTVAVVKNRSVNNGSVKEVTLLTRELFKQNSFKTLKYIEFFIKTLILTRVKSHYSWFANFDFLHIQIFFLFLGKKVIWDMHEYPSRIFVKNPIFRFLFRQMLKKNLVICCNKERLQQLEEDLSIKVDNSLIIRNYPSEDTLVKIKQISQSSTNQPNKNETFKVGIVGGFLPGRYVEKAIEAIDKLYCDNGKNPEILLIGGNVYPDTYRDNVDSTGPISFESLIERSANISVSLCFYDPSELNNYLCEPNRFYQAIALNQYIVTFDFPTLRQFNYSRHRVISVENFESDLIAVLKSILLEISLGDKPENFSLSDITFENQFPNFKTVLDEYYD
jgi:hypothetical protein